MANPIKKCVLHSVQSDGTMVDLYPRTKLASVADMTAFARTLNGAADAAAARNTLEIQTSKDIINIIYPVGSVITLTNDTDPNELYQGTTWVKMDAGRVLVSAGTYTEGSDTYTYALGDKGGEAKHQSTIDELVNHGHTMSVAGNHTHLIANDQVDGGSGLTNKNYLIKKCTWNSYENFELIGSGKAPNIGLTSSSGGHMHSISATGGNKPHENRPPYIVINRWKRTV